MKKNHFKLFYSMANNNNKFFSEFPPISNEEWRAKIDADLKGKDFERALVWRTNEGFNVQPYYRQDDLENLGSIAEVPGQFPFTRGTKTDNDWLIRQDIVVECTKEANIKSKNAVAKGATSLGFIFKNCGVITAEDIKTLMDGIDPSKVEINFVPSCKKELPTEAYINYCESVGVSKADIKGSVDFDPISNFTLKGKYCGGFESQIAKVKAQIELVKDVPGFKVLAVNGKNFNNAGSSIVQELGYALSIGAEYLTSLTEAGLSIDSIASTIKFNFAVGGNYFMELAKVRTARTLWAQIVKSFEPACEESCVMLIHSETSNWNKTVYDPYVNMLRTQTEAMSAVLGGTDSMTVKPFNEIFEPTNTFSERIARNQQHLLKEECHFDKVADPAAGSYYVETLTQSIAEQAWKIFLAVDEQGGFTAAFRAGSVLEDVNAMATKRFNNIATRRENILGINQFPNFTEYMETEIEQEVLSTTDLTCSTPEEGIETLKLTRGAQAFESLRNVTDKFSKENKRPLAYMLTIGNLTFRKARAQFACNFFAVAGYSVQDNNGFSTIEEGIKAAKEANADIVVLCSSDDEYVTLAPEAFKAIDNATLVVAGSPACMDDLKSQGIENFIHVKSNLLEELKGYQTKLGINS